ncbi:MAG TPA: glycosyltransferase family 2 protein, partial [Acidimicrobiia bacterium]|nr:glycosyltransferase family 2 protein [Acidimicrobiia bacterium]
IADDDVRYDASALERVVRLLDEADVVRPQNHFDPCPWHAVWDSARTLLNRAAGGDFPGTLAVRRAFIAGGYDGDVLFENLELMRTVVARGGSILTPLDCYVRRLPPPAGRFWSQRRRQAYDDLAQPARLLAGLLVIPMAASGVVRRRWGRLVAAGAASILIAEWGRARGGGREVFPAAAPLCAPLWLLERGVTDWLAVWDRAVRGGCRYSGVVIRRAASSVRVPPRHGPPPLIDYLRL